MIRKGRHKLHIGLFISIFLIIVIIIKFISFNEESGAFWLSLRFTFFHVIPVVIVLSLGLTLQLLRRHRWDRIYLIAWIVFGVVCLVALTVSVISSYNGDLAKDGLYSWIGSVDSLNADKQMDVLELLDERIATNPNDDEAYLMRGLARYNIKDYFGSILDFSRVIDLRPDSENAFGARGASKSKLKDYKGAIIDYNKAIELSGFMGANYIKERADLKYLIQDFKGALVDYRRVIELEGTKLTDKNLVFATFLNIANIEFELEDYEAAVFDYSFAIDFNPGTNIDAYYKRGLANLKLGLRNDACSDFRKASELGNMEVYDLILKYCQ